MAFEFLLFMIVNMVMGGIKRPNDDVEEFARVNASNITQRVEADPDAAKRYKRIFKCKEKGCNKEYDSHQALGGHRASHKNFRILHTGSTKSVPKLHRCELCGMGFAIGQALGGHMRKHRLGKLEVNKATVLCHRQVKLEDNKAMGDDNLCWCRPDYGALNLKVDGSARGIVDCSETLVINAIQQLVQSVLKQEHKMPNLLQEQLEKLVPEQELLKLGFNVRAGVRSTQRAESLVKNVQQIKLDDGSQRNPAIEKLHSVTKAD
ncbi:Zinc finger, C2H2 [Artemisia annua]|uniref:Zinc finger, C2H2 n=1 Tax=Artemisia annua TaxID=35608 RepID=A0A2U1M5C4_ARTAN|nr:Zinc finger, C2H2 [Artemisia annua]